MSYSITDTKFEDEDNYPRFYATIPTDELTNRARLKLLYDFGWRRVAIVVSDVNDIVRNGQLVIPRILPASVQWNLCVMDTLGPA